MAKREMEMLILKRRSYSKTSELCSLVKETRTEEEVGKRRKSDRFSPSPGSLWCSGLGTKFALKRLFSILLWMKTRMVSRMFSTSFKTCLLQVLAVSLKMSPSNS